MERAGGKGTKVEREFERGGEWGRVWRTQYFTSTTPWLWLWKVWIKVFIECPLNTGS